MVEIGTLWKAIIRLKYGTKEGGWCTRTMGVGYWVSLWKEINKEASQLKLNNNFMIGDGIGVRFWEDTWCTEDHYMRCLACCMCGLTQKGES